MGQEAAQCLLNLRRGDVVTREQSSQPEHVVEIRDGRLYLTLWAMQVGAVPDARGDLLLLDPRLEGLDERPILPGLGEAPGAAPDAHQECLHLGIVHE